MHVPFHQISALLASVYKNTTVNQCTKKELNMRSISGWSQHSLSGILFIANRARLVNYTANHLAVFRY